MATEAISRQPEATDSIRGAWMIGLVFIETAIIYALLLRFWSFLFCNFFEQEREQTAINVCSVR